MEFLLVVVLVGIFGGMLGYFAGKKCKPPKNYMAEGSCVGMVLGVLTARFLDLSVAYGMAIGILIGELAGMLIPKKER